MKTKNNSILKSHKDESSCAATLPPELNLEFGAGPVYIPINGVCHFADWQGVRRVVVHSQTLFRYDLEDQVAQKIAAVYLFREGWAEQQELAVVLDCHVSTLRGWTRRIEREGIVGAARKKRRSPLLKLGGTRDTMVARLFHEGLSNYAIGRRLGVGEYAIRLALKRLSLKRDKKAKDPELVFSETQANKELSSENEVDKPINNEIESNSIDCSREDKLSEETKVLVKENIHSVDEKNKGVNEETNSVLSSEKVATQTVSVSEEMSVAVSPLQLPELFEAECSLDSTPESRTNDRLMAAFGLVNDAAPLFRTKLKCWGVGSLLAIPFIVDGKILEAFQKVYGRLPGFFGLRNTVMSLLFMAFLRINRIEQLKEKNPYNLGGIIGLDRLPETKTLRRKFTNLASLGKGLELMRVLAQVRMNKQQVKNVLGFLYVDGHVKEYRGHRRLGKTYIACRNCVAKGSTDVWVHDADGGPLFVVPCELNQGLTKILEKVLDEVETLIEGDRRPTIIFDRGGWKKALFTRLIKRGWDIITYRKGWSEKLPLDSFHKKSLLIDGKTLEYSLHDMSVLISETKLQDNSVEQLWMRQVTRLKDGTRQTPVLTTRQDLQAVEVLYRMFNRWRQENFFRYAREEYLLDGLWNYWVEPVPEGLDHPNPEWVKRDKALAKARNDFDKLLTTQGKLKIKLERETGKLTAAKLNKKRKPAKSLKTKVDKLKEELENLSAKITKTEARIETLRITRNEVEKRIPATDLQCLNRETRLISDCIKMTAFQIETELVDRVADHYARVSDEGRKLIIAALHSEGEIEVTDDQLVISLNKQSSPHRTKAIQALCIKLNQMNVCFPGTQLQMKYNVA